MKLTTMCAVQVQMAFLPPYSPDLNPVEFLWAWLKRHALANFCPADLNELNLTARAKLKRAQRVALPSSPRAGFRLNCGDVAFYGKINRHLDVLIQAKGTATLSSLVQHFLGHRRTNA